MRTRGTLKARVLAAAALVAGALAGSAMGAEPLRVCADPDNLPFTKQDGPERGLYIELAQLLGAKLGAPVEYTWYYTNYQRRALRNTFGANACDVVMALPTDYRARGLEKTRPYLRVGYVVVSAPGLAFKTLDDLRMRRIGVQFGTTPHIVLNTIDGFTSTTFRTHEEVFSALTKGEIDAAFLWGPVAGYENSKRHANRWQVTSVSGHDFVGEVAAAVRRDKVDLVAAVDKALADLKPQIEQLAVKYGFPLDRPVHLAQARQVAVPAELVVRVADTPSPGAEDIQAGRTRFNSQCSHCHGGNAVTPLRERDLRRLKLRYDANWSEVALTAIKNGRSDKGMPTWKDVLKETEINEVLAFLSTLQR